MKTLNINFKCKVSNKLTSSAGMVKYKNFKMQLLLSSPIVNDLFKSDKAIVSIGGINCNSLAMTFIVILEHEITHIVLMLLHYHKLNVGKEKSGHTVTFKNLVKNMYHHKKISHDLKFGDISNFGDIYKKIDIGDKIRCDLNKADGIVVRKSKKYVVVKINNEFLMCILNKISIIEKSKENPIDIIKNNLKVNDIKEIKFKKSILKIKITRLESDKFYGIDINDNRSYWFYYYILLS